MTDAALRQPLISRRVIGSMSRHAVLIGFCLLALLPVYFMVVNAFKTQQEYITNRFGLPRNPVMASFADAMAGGDLYIWLLNSVLVTVASVTLSTTLAAFAAYPLSLMRWKFGPFIFALLIALLVVPPIVLVVPIFELVVDLRQLNTYHTVIVIYAGITLPFSTFLLASFFQTISRPLIEAARIDGASSWRVFQEIVVPLSLPALITVGIVQSLWVWNEVLIAVIFLQDQSLRTLMVGLTLFNSRYRHDVPVVMAGMILAAIPMVALYLVGQRFFIRGLTAGGVKG
jgi:ABC-type glycerol-3-phosphate transport system permease component